MKNIYLLFLLIVTFTNFSLGQLSVQPANSSTNKLENIIKSLVGTGVTVSNIISNLPSNTNIYGTFSESSNQLGISNGLIMTTGSIQNSIGPNDDNNKSDINFNPGDFSLSNLIRNTTLDACVIEFDITTPSTQISFNYIFASEEYPEYVNSFYNDVFAFFISGPGISGQRNIALIPGTTTPVSINNVNEFEFATYFVDNGDGVLGGGPITQYNGYTRKLKAVAQVFPCQTYHLKLAIADVEDANYDSGVFIESGSLSGNDNIIIGNSIAPDSLKVCSSDFPLTLTAGVNFLSNYVWSKDGTVVATGTKFHNVNAAGWYRVHAFGDAFCSWTDSILIKVDLAFTSLASNDTLICEGGTASLNVQNFGGSGKPYTYSWSPATYLSNTTIANPVSIPTNDITYSVLVTSGICKKVSQVRIVIINKINLNVSNSTKGCVNKNIQLSASGAQNYLWTPGINLNDSTISNPIANLTTSTVFKLKGYNSCFADSVDVPVSIYEFPPVKAYGDTIICYGGVANLSSDYFSQYNYSWSPPTSLSDWTIYNPTAIPNTNTSFILSINNNGCITADTVNVGVREKIVASIDMPNYGQVPWTVKLGNLSTGASAYTWDITGFSSTTLKEPTLIFKEENYYSIILKASNDLGCFDHDSITIKTYQLFIPNLITPNGDNKNDSFEITGLGDLIRVEIFNQWGDKVYKKSNYRNEWNGEGLSDGVYYYIITDFIGTQDYKGWVQIIR